jgi:hypothetical protein
MHPVTMKSVVIITPVTAIISFTVINTSIKLLFIYVLNRQRVAHYRISCKTVEKTKIKNI